LKNANKKRPFGDPLKGNELVITKIAVITAYTKGTNESVFFDENPVASLLQLSDDPPKIKHR